MTKALQLIPAKTELMEGGRRRSRFGFQGKEERKELPLIITLRTLEFFEDRLS